MQEDISAPTLAFQESPWWDDTSRLGHGEAHCRSSNATGHMFLPIVSLYLFPGIKNSDLTKDNCFRVIQHLGMP